MKATARILIGLISVALGLWLAPCFGDPGSTGSATFPTNAASGSSGGDRAASNRRQCDDLLARARQALAENDLNAAESLVSRAEALGVSYGTFYPGETPAKVRRDLERQLKAAGRAPAQPGRFFSPLSVGSGTEPVTDPFAARREALPATGSAQGITPLPPVAGGDRLQSDQHLLAARRALAEGDVRRAWDDLSKAKRLAVPYGPRDDGPAKVESLIQAYDDLMAQKSSRGNTEAFSRQYARILMDQAEGLLRYRDYDKAEYLARLAAGQRVNFTPYEPSPQQLLERIAQERRPAPAAYPTAGASSASPPSMAAKQHAAGLLKQARAALAAGDLRAAESLARQVEQMNLPPSSFALGEDRPDLVLVDVQKAAVRTGSSVVPASDTVVTAAGESPYDRQASRALYDPARDSSHNTWANTQQPAGSMIDETSAGQQRLLQQVAMDVAHQEGEAKALRETDPMGALALLEQTRRKVEASGLEPGARDRLLGRLDRSLADMQQYIDANRARIDLDEKNQHVRQQIEREQQLSLEVSDKLASLVEEFNQLMREERFAEAEVVARRAAELDPRNPLTQQLVLNAKFVRRYQANWDLQQQKDENFWKTLASVDRSAVPFDDSVPMVFPDAREWEQMTIRRREWLSEGGRRRSEREIEIEQKLKTPVLLQFQNAPLSQVMDYLARMAAVNMHLDPEGLAQEGISTEDPVTINLSQEISLQSALNLILEPRHLGYVIKDEVLKITSEQLREGTVYAYVYNVADLVIPIPNFVPSSGMGLAAAYNNAMSSVGFGASGPFGGSAAPLAVLASRDGSRNSAMVSPSVLAQMPTSPAGTSSSTMPMGFGPGGLGGAAMADFDSLIDLITTTVQPTTWDDVGGAGSIAPFETNLSLVISQTQDVHDEIADLLQQLRRLQDLQVTIEVRFITLNDNFFERIGVDFDFDIDDDIDRPFQVFGRRVEGEDDDDDDVTLEPARDTRDVDHDRSVVVGLQQPGVFSADLDIPFTQGSYSLAVPQFGGFDATAGASLGFAILSDIEAFFFINAAQGDRRSNVLQAPKVTLFNGQQAMVSDTSQSPFVISVIPVVGDFAAAQQPVIVVLNEGTHLTVQAVVSDDRRFVRLTVVPFFSQIGDVRTFTFEGSETTTASSSQEGNQTDPDDNTKKSDTSTVSRRGTTVQLPTFSYITVTTTVSVPDGGTVLLGGIKRLSEGRNEFGVPMLNKLPYINRLFKNVGIGRETQSLMMMVTPRIIIQEEEEEALGIVTR